MKLVSRAEWGARSPKNHSKGDLKGPSTCHWNGPQLTVGGQIIWGHDKCASLVRGTQNYHMDHNGWADIAYNFVVCPHGYTFEGRGLNVINAAQGTNVGNRTSHGIMCLAGEGNPFNFEEKVGFSDAVKYVSDHTDAPDTCIGHRDWHSTQCPGNERYTWVRGGMPVFGVRPAPETTPTTSTTPATSPTSAPSAPSAANHDHPLLKVGSNGPVVRRVQTILRDKAGARNLKVDGAFGPNTQEKVRDLQRFFKLKADGIVGSKTWDVIEYLAAKP